MKKEDSDKEILNIYALKFIHIKMTMINDDLFDLNFHSKYLANTLLFHIQINLLITCLRQ